MVHFKKLQISKWMRFNGQTVVLLFLITPQVSLPVGLRFYQPEPAVQEWKKNEEELKQQGVKKSG